MLELLAGPADLPRQVQPSIAGVAWHSVLPESLQAEGLDVLGLVRELRDGPLIHCVVVPAAIHPEAIETGARRDSLGDLVQHLVDGLGRTCPEELQPDILGGRVLKLFAALLVERRDRPLFSGHLNVLAVEPDLAVVHDELRGVWSGRSLVRQVHDIDAVDAEREGVLLKVKVDGELPVFLLITARRINFVLVQYRVDRWVVEAPKTKQHLVSKSSRKMARQKQLETRQRRIYE